MRFPAFLLLCLFMLVLAPATALHAEKKEETEEDTLSLLKRFGDVFEKVREEYVEEPSDKELIEAAINGMLTHLDPHSTYLNQESFKEMQVQTKGEFGGLGIEVTMRNGLVYIVSPIDDTPAFEAGLQAGDYISHLDGESVMGLTITEAVKKMRGKPDTSITLTILREAEEEPFDVEITRAIIQIRSVKSRMEEDVAYLRINSFSEQTTELVEEHVQDLLEQDPAPVGMVLDLRNNPGGLLDQAIGVADAFLTRGEVVSTRGREPENTKRFDALSGDITKNLPIVVVINNGSASASEIVAGALQDHRRAIIVGTPSFGKGSVQTVIPLPEETAMRLTTARYYTPSGHSIQAKGITPDILIENASIEFKKAKGNTTEASLPRHLREEQERLRQEAEEAAQEEEAEEEPTDASKEGDPDKKGEAQNALAELYEEDYVLGRAVDLVRALALAKAHEQ